MDHYIEKISILNIDTEERADSYVLTEDKDIKEIIKEVSEIYGFFEEDLCILFFTEDSKLMVSKTDKISEKELLKTIENIYTLKLSTSSEEIEGYYVFENLTYSS